MDIMRIDATFGRWDELLALILDAFAYMDGVIDPPSSAHRLTPQNLREKAEKEIGLVAIDDGTLAGCIFCKPESDGVLYLGKFAISPALQGKGTGRALMAHAETMARQAGYRTLRLETRIELVSNHERFRAWGFEKTAERSHAGYTRITQIEMRKELEQAVV